MTPKFSSHVTIRRCIGDFDLLHHEQMNMFKSCLQHGDTVVAGVHNDKDVAAYKRSPLVGQEERYATVQACKYVDEVIREFPLCPDADFLAQHRIDVVVCSAEHDNEKDEYVYGASWRRSFYAFSAAFNAEMCI